MPVRLYTQQTGIIYPTLIAGYVYAEDIFGFGFLPIADIVYADIVDQFGEPPSQWSMAGIVTPLLEIVSFDPEAISIFSGNPSKGKFGQLGVSDRGAAVDWEFCYNILQRYKTRKIQLRPVPTAYPLNPADVGEPVERDWILNILISLSPNVLFPGDLTSTIDTLAYDLQLTVQARYVVEYVCGLRDPLGYGAEVLGFYPY